MIPLAVLKLHFWSCFQKESNLLLKLQPDDTACGIETFVNNFLSLWQTTEVATGWYRLRYWNAEPPLTPLILTVTVATGWYRLRYWNRDEQVVSLTFYSCNRMIPLAVLKLPTDFRLRWPPQGAGCNRMIPLAVLKQIIFQVCTSSERCCNRMIPLAVLKLLSSNLQFSDLLTESCNRMIPLAVLKLSCLLSRSPGCFIVATGWYCLRFVEKENHPKVFLQALGLFIFGTVL